MSLSVYDILCGNCSKYETNHLHMYVDYDVDLGGQCDRYLSHSKSEKINGTEEVDKKCR